MTTSRHRLAALAGAGMLAVAVSACGSSSSASSGTTVPATPATTVPAPTTTAMGGTAGGLAKQADALCSQIDTALKDLHHLNLKSPTNEGALASDFGALNSDANNISMSAKGSAQAPQVSPVVSTVQAAIHAGEAAAGQVAKGDVNGASANVKTMVNDLGMAQSKAASANLGNCSAAASASGVSSTTAG